MREVYVDILFLINFSMDFLCFFLTSKILHRKMKPFRMVLGSVFGALYAVSAVFVNTNSIAAFLADLTVCVIMCALVYVNRESDFRSYIISLGVYFGMSALIGGVMTAFCSLLNRMNLPLEVIGEDGISAWMFALLAAVSAITAGAVGRFFRRSAGEKTGEVCITCRGRSVRLRGVTDTGNLLRDPIGGKSVVVVSVASVAELLPPGLPAAIRAGDYSSDQFRRLGEGLGIRLIPTRTASGDGMLIGILPEQMTVTDSRGTRETDALFAPAEIDFRGFEALLPPELDA